MSGVISTGFYPFWFWNDYVTEDEVRRQISEMASQGIKGFFIHSRQGLQRPYLSESFFEVVDAAVDAAKKHRMTVCLYDEYPYPSGIAGGEVTLGNPKYHATRLVHQNHEVEGGFIRLSLPAGKVLSAKAFPVVGDQVVFSDPVDLRHHVGMVLTEDSYVETGLTSYSRKRYFASEPRPVLEVTLPPRRFKIYVSCQVEVRYNKYWGNFTDVLNPDAVKAFINLTHERYSARYGDELGNTIAAIFVDEVEPGWSDRIPEVFLSKYGYDLCEYMPALQDRSHPDHRRVARDLYSLTYELFCDTFEKPVSEWCKHHGISYCGEKPSMRLSQLRYMDIPGCDVGHKKAGDGLDVLQARIRGNARAVASAAYFYGKEAALCECYHSLGWSGTLQDAKVIAEALLVSGVNCLVPHGFFYTTHALKKHDAPPSFFYQMPYWRLFSRLSERLDRIGELIEDTHIDAQVLVVDPHSGIPGKREEGVYADLLQALAQRHIDFHIVDTDILQMGEIRDGSVQIKDISAKLVIVPPMQVIEDPLNDWLSGFRQRGGHVIVCGEGTDRESVDIDDLMRAVCQVVQPSLSVQCDGQEFAGAYVSRRVSKDRALWLLLNSSDQTVTVQIRAASRPGTGEARLREVPLDPNVPYGLEERDGCYTRVINPFESLVIEEVCHEKPPEDCCEQVGVPIVDVQIAGAVSVELRNKNLLRMYEWDMSVLDEDGQVLQTSAVPAVPISDQLEKGRFRFAPVNHKFFGSVPKLDWPRMAVRYEFQFDSDYDGPIELVMEPGSIVGDWRIYINDTGPIGIEQFAPTQAHVSGSLGVDVTAFLRRGRNSVRVDLTAEKANHGLLNCLYLAGDFGVSLDPLCLVHREGIGAFEDYRANLIPYYAGSIDYTTEFELESVPEAREAILRLDYGREFREATEVSINGHEFQPVLWEPRCVRISTDQLRKGNNVLKTRVHTTLIRSFEGVGSDD